MNIKEELTELGFKKCVEVLDEKVELMRKTSIAYQHYDFITEESVVKFNEELKKETMKEDKNAYSFKRLRFTEISSYEKIPPTEALKALRTAKGRLCFDTFEIADLENVKIDKDPILFGCIKGCGDKFFLAQWDDDVTFEQIKKHAEQMKI
jgi:hypothetical protein